MEEQLAELLQHLRTVAIRQGNQRIEAFDGYTLRETRLLRNVGSSRSE